MSELWAFVENLSLPGIVTLAPDEARHVVSRRLRIGDGLRVFDAQGRTAPGTIAGLERRAVAIEVGEIEFFDAPNSGFQLATAIPKGERLSTMLQMWTQLGLEVWQPLICEDSAVRKLDVDSPRIRRILIEGCKVARRPWAMRVLTPQRIDAVLEGRDDGTALYFANREALQSGFDSKGGCIFIGPEAGFSESELALFEAAGAKAISLGDYNLRIETAAVAAMAVFNTSQGAPGMRRTHR